MKKKLFLSLIMLILGILILGAVSVSAATYGDYTYTVSNGEATITDFKISVSGTIEIPSEINGYLVTTIGSQAFIDCSSLTSITIPDSVTSIGNEAFCECNSLTDVTIGNGVTSIGSWAFSDCSSLTNISIPDGVTSIGNAAFQNCDSLTSITIPDSVTSIGDYAFNGCSSLTSITIPDGVTSIGDYAFCDCYSLTNIIVSKNNINYLSLNGVLFNKSKTELICCPGGKSGKYNILDGVTSIGDWAFDGCSSLTSITIPDSVTSIGDYAFCDCYSLTNIIVSKNNTEYSSMDGVLFNKNATQLICCPAGKTEEYVIPDSVTSIGVGAFYSCSSLTSITIPDGVTDIGSSAFRGCSSLTSITIPDGVTSIGVGAFYSCRSLTSITIPDSVTSVGSFAFRGCSSLTSIEVLKNNPSYVSIDGVLFNKNATQVICCPEGKVGEYTIPDSVTRIGDAFRDCSSLTSITIPDSVTSIGGQAFYSCESLTSITIPDGVISIGSYAFRDCSSLTSITIPDGVTGIGYGAFYNCSSLTSITIPDSVTGIGDDAFYGCSSLTSVTIPDSVTRIGEDAFYNTAYYDDESNWEDGVLYIGKHLIDAKTTLSGAYEIKEGTKYIGERAFYYCSSLTSITIPDSVTSIGSYAFQKCSSLTTVYFNGKEEDWNEITIDSYNTYLTSAAKKYFFYITFKDSDGTVIKEATADYGTKIVLPDTPADKDPYTFDYWKNYTDGMVITENVTFTAVYKYKDYEITVSGLDDIVTVTYNDSFQIPVQEKQEHIFKGYYTEENGQGTKVTDKDGNSVTNYNYAENITVYPYFVHEFLNKIKIEGTDEATVGTQGITQTVSFATDKSAYGMYCTIKYPEYLLLTNITPKDFEIVEKYSSKTEGEYEYITFICQYTESGDNIPTDKTVTAFELTFDVLKTAPVGEATIEITDDTLLVGSTDYFFDEKINHSLTITPKLAESIEITGETSIDKETAYTAVILPDYTSNKEVIWEVSDESIATVSKDGVVTPIKCGTIILTATTTDGSGVYDEKEITVTVYAKLDSLVTDTGVWDIEFNPDIREYTIYVAEDAKKIVLTPTSASGSLRINGGLVFNGKQKEVELLNDITEITVTRSGVSGYAESNYIITVVKYSGTKTNISEDKKTITVTNINVNSGHIVVLALYKGEQVVEVQYLPCTAAEILFTTDKSYDSVKVMIWESLKTIRPIYNAEDVK